MFGSAKIQRWFERLEYFDFSVEYREGEKLVVADALSRSVTKTQVEKIKDTDEREFEILRLHENLNHRKTIKEEL
jgi:hypothetical protein